MGDTDPTVVHVQVDGDAEAMNEVYNYITDKPIDGYEFIITDTDVSVSTAVDMDGLADEVPNSVAERLETGDTDE